MPKTWTANQLVASNLRRARRMHAPPLTQKEAAELLEPYLGKRWSVASFSAAESTARNGARAREFSADEILAFASAFEQPVAFFFTPPEEESRPVSCGGTTTVALPELLEAVGTIDGPRLKAIYSMLPEEARPALDRVLRRTVLDRLASPSVRNVTEHAANLRRVANALEAADDRVQTVFVEELDRAFEEEN